MDFIHAHHPVASLVEPASVQLALAGAEVGETLIGHHQNLRPTFSIPLLFQLQSLGRGLVEGCNLHVTLDAWEGFLKVVNELPYQVAQCHHQHLVAFADPVERPCLADQSLPAAWVIPQAVPMVLQGQVQPGQLVVPWNPVEGESYL